MREICGMGGPNVSLPELFGVEFSSLSGVCSQAAGPKPSGEMAAIVQPCRHSRR